MIGGTDDLDPVVAHRLRRQLADGALAMAIGDALTVVSGGTAAGVLALFGSGLEHRSPTAPVIGVVPSGKVAWNASADRVRDDQVPLESHHTHFVLVNANEWGDETPMLLAIVRELANHAPTVALLASGGPIAMRELTGLLEAGTPAVVLGGSGRLADDVARTMTAARRSDHVLASAKAGGLIEVVDIGAPSAELSRRLRDMLVMNRG